MDRSGGRGGPSGLAVTDLYKSFGSHPVLNGIELDVPEGSLTAILGPSGSGKTTLLRVIAGFERADRGTVVLGGRWWRTPTAAFHPNSGASATSPRRVRCSPT